METEMDYSVMTDEKVFELSRDGKDEVLDYLLD